MASKASSRVLIDHDEIQSWAEQHGAKPAAVRDTSGGDEVGIIRLDFPGYGCGESLEEIEWDEWFEKFEDNNLALVIQENTANGQRSNFDKLVNRENVEASSEEESKSSARRSSAARSASSSSGRSTKSKAAGARASGSSMRSFSSRKSTLGKSERRGSRRKSVSAASQKPARSRKKAA